MLFLSLFVKLFAGVINYSSLGRDTGVSLASDQLLESDENAAVK